MVDYKLLRQLREETGVSVSLLKKALEETKNNLQEAKKLLIKWGNVKAQEKENKETLEGGIFSYVHHNNKVAVLVELLCETDFVSKNAEFQSLGREISMQVASLKPKDVNQLMDQEYIRDPQKKIKDLIKEAVLKFGENIKVKHFVIWELGQNK